MVFVCVCVCEVGARALDRPREKPMPAFAPLPHTCTATAASTPPAWAMPACTGARLTGSSRVRPPEAVPRAAPKGEPALAVTASMLPSARVRLAGLNADAGAGEASHRGTRRQPAGVDMVVRGRERSAERTRGVNAGVNKKCSLALAHLSAFTLSSPRPDSPTQSPTRAFYPPDTHTRTTHAGTSSTPTPARQGPARASES